MNDVREPVCAERLGNYTYPRTVNRRIHDLHVMMPRNRVGRQRNSLQVRDVLLIDLLTDQFDQFLLSFEPDIGRVADFIDFGNRVFVVRSNHLRSIVPICLVTVIFLRIM